MCKQVANWWPVYGQGEWAKTVELCLTFSSLFVPGMEGLVAVCDHQAGPSPPGTGCLSLLELWPNLNVECSFGRLPLGSQCLLTLQHH